MRVEWRGTVTSVQPRFRLGRSFDQRHGATRKVPGRRGMSFDEGDWVDDEETAHRGPDD